jgi:hypothetical protein
MFCFADKIRKIETTLKKHSPAGFPKSKSRRFFGMPFGKNLGWQAVIRCGSIKNARQGVLCLQPMHALRARCAKHGACPVSRKSPLHALRGALSIWQNSRIVQQNA